MYMHKPGEAQNNNIYRTIGPIRSVDTYIIDEIRKKKTQEDQPAVYTLQEMDLNKTVASKQLQLVARISENLDLKAYEY